MFFNEIWKLYFSEFIILIFAVIFIVIAIYTKHIGIKPHNGSVKNYVSIDYHRLLEMLMNK